jgi:hypothetical protein
MNDHRLPYYQIPIGPNVEQPPRDLQAKEPDTIQQRHLMQLRDIPVIIVNYFKKKINLNFFQF